MPVHRNQYDEEFKKNAVKLSYASPKTVRAVAASIRENGLYLLPWRRRLRGILFLKCDMQG